jgi:quercetin dioxygenase-like cupin family protein
MSPTKSPAVLTTTSFSGSWHLHSALALLVVIVPTASPAALQEERKFKMEITRKADMKTVDGPEQYFTGKATITGQFQRDDPSRVSGAIVHFEPGARTAWHTHPLGQTLIVTEGVGWTQVVGGPVHEFHAGDILWCPPEHKHWHGATPHQGMTHVAIQESLNGSPVTWMEKVTDEQYLAGPAKD